MDDFDSALFDPFRRKDRFGLIGTDPLCFSDRLVVYFFAVFILPLRVLFCLLLLLLCYLSCYFTQLLPTEHQPSVIAALGTRICRLCLMVLGIRVNWINKKSEKDTFASGIVSNHVSWIDILLHMAYNFPSFVAAEEVLKLSFVGKISQMMHCIYVQRLQKNKDYLGVSNKVKERMLETWKNRSPFRKVLLFPEGTTTNGDYLLKFKRGAFLAGVPVQPVVLVYSSRWVSPAWETITGPQHLWLLLCTPGAKVDFIELPVYVPDDQERNDPEIFGENVRDFMIKASGIEFRKSNATMQDKRNYQKLLKARFEVKDQNNKDR